jgi:flagellar basal body-associated protein FliL
MKQSQTVSSRLIIIIIIIIIIVTPLFAFSVLSFLRHEGAALHSPLGVAVSQDTFFSHVSK